jgi:hypothetical protein
VPHAINSNSDQLAKFSAAASVAAAKKPLFLEK